jgi:hypothetical protein
VFVLLFDNLELIIRQLSMEPNAKVKRPQKDKKEKLGGNGDKKGGVFGVRLDADASYIPVVLKKCVEYLDARGKCLQL